MADLGSALQSMLQVPGLQQLLNQGILEQQQSLPLRTAVRQQAMNMLPGGAFPGGGGGTVGGGIPNLSAMPMPNLVTPPPSGTDWTKILSLLALGLGGGGALAKALNGGSSGGASGGNLANIVNALKKLGGGGSNFSPSPTGQPSLPSNPYNPNNFFTGWDPSVSNSNGVPYLISDPGSYYDSSGRGATVTDPSGGSGVGPGMQAYYDDNEDY